MKISRRVVIDTENDMRIYEKIDPNQFEQDCAESNRFVIEHGLLEMCGYECQYW